MRSLTTPDSKAVVEEKSKSGGSASSDAWPRMISLEVVACVVMTRNQSWEPDQ